MKRFFLLLGILLLFCVDAWGIIIDGDPLDNGMGTFKDTVTGREWIDLNLPRDQYYNAIINEGFTVAGSDDVMEMLASNPITSNNFDSLAQIMGISIYDGNYLYEHIGERIIWGAYLDIKYENGIPTDSSPGYILSFADFPYWRQIDDIANPGPSVGLYAYRNTVPEPGTLMLFGLGVLSLSGLTRRQSHN